MTYPRQTLRQTVHLDGLGLHSGRPVRVAIHPSQDGIAFRYGSNRVAARPENVSETERCTKLGEIATIEHLMAAFAGLSVTDAEVELDGPELPALDGSAIGFVQEIEGAGVVAWGESHCPGLFSRIFLQESNRKLSISAGEGRWRYEYRTPVWPYFQVYGSTNVVGDFVREIASARTFGHAKEVAVIQAAGLAKGLSLESALVLGDSGYENEARYPNEPSRHKLLDAMGDLYLAGVPLRFLNVVAQGTGHRMNVQAAAQLAQAVQMPSGPNR